MRVVTAKLVATFVLILAAGMVSSCGPIQDVRDAVPDIEAGGGGESITVADGDSTITIQGDDKIPEWFPSAMPLPGNITEVTASSVGTGTDSYRLVAVHSSDDYQTTLDAVDAGLAAAGIIPESREVIEGMAGGATIIVIVDDVTWQIGIVAIDEGARVVYASAPPSDD